MATRLQIIGIALLTNIGINTAGYAVSAYQKTEKYYDTCGSLSFIASSAVSLGLSTRFKPSLIHPRHVLLGITTSFWASRLLVFLTSRVRRMKGDRRFDGVKEDPKQFAVYWAMQSAWVGIVSFPTVAVLATPAAGLARVGWLTVAGLGIWATGFGFEVVADAQKAEWQNKFGHERFTKFIDSGLWSLCRYPNYFGEMTLWTGSYIMAASAFPKSLKARIGFASSPLFVTYLLTRLSGIPTQERQAQARFKGNMDYARYVENTNILFPGRPYRKEEKP
ncbi:hypothetical protein BDR26DRAFT_832400 [Obelidium mucronatum]|nr:hypothetical protein BDR26DRAFT_832400 [Obelidium mucronatum]